MSEERAQRRLAAILAADVVGYSRLMGVDEKGTRSLFNTHLNDLIKPTIAQHFGRIVKTMGDGLLVEFASVVDAVECAVAIQRGMNDGSTGKVDKRRITFRIGVNLGDVIVEGDDIHGDGVNVAARLEGLAEPGGIVVSGKVYDEVRGKLDIGFTNLGLQDVKNIAESVRAFSIVLDGSAHKAGITDASGSDKPAIAVLPFTNMSGDSEQEYFADGMTEDIITGLSRIRQLLVTARNTTFTYKGVAIDVQDAATDLGVRYVLEGSVRKSGNRLRITIQLIDGVSRNHLWAERYDRLEEDIFEIQDDITQAVVSALIPEINRSEIERARRKPPHSLNAWDICQRGLWHQYRLNKEDSSAAIELYSKAIELDSSFVAPYFGLVECYTNDWLRGDTERDLEELFKPARKAVDVDPDDPLSHMALGMAHFINRDHRLAIAEFEIAKRLNPNDARNFARLGHSQKWSGRAEEAIENFKTAIRLSPRDPLLGVMTSGISMACLFLCRYEECVEWARSALQHPHVQWPIHAHLVSALGHLARKAEAKEALGNLLKLSPEITTSFVEQQLPITDEGYRDHLIDGLRKAGLPD